MTLQSKEPAKPMPTQLKQQAHKLLKIALADQTADFRDGQANQRLVTKSHRPGKSEKTVETC
jgi:hypothetical protein